MKLDPTALRQRRLQAAVPVRELARAAGVSAAVVIRLEQDGEASALTFGTVAKLLEAISMDLHEAVYRETPPAQADDDEELVRSLGMLLMTLNTRVVSVDELAAELGVTIERLLVLAHLLAGRLEVAGLRLHHSVTGMRLLPAAGSPFQRTWRRSRAQLLKVLNRGDVHLLYEVATRRVEAKRISHRRDGIMRLHKLEGAGLMELGDDNVLRLTESARYALMD